MGPRVVPSARSPDCLVARSSQNRSDPAHAPQGLSVARPCQDTPWSGMRQMDEQSHTLHWCRNAIERGLAMLRRSGSDEGIVLEPAAISVLPDYGL